MPRAREKLSNAKAFKVISTTVPPDMHKALKAQVTEEYTMSHLLRDLIQQSDLMRGAPPSPQLSQDLANTVVSLKEEIAQLRKDMQALSLTGSAGAAPALLQKAKTKEEPAKAIEIVSQPPIRSIPESPDYYFDDLDEFDASKDPDWAWCQKIIEEVIEEDGILESDEKAREKSEYMSAETEDEPSEEMQKEPAQEKHRDGKTLFGRLTAMLGVSRKTA